METINSTYPTETQRVQKSYYCCSKRLHTFKKVMLIALTTLIGISVGATVACLPVVFAAVGLTGLVALTSLGAATGFICGVAFSTRCLSCLSQTSLKNAVMRTEKSLTRCLKVLEDILADASANTPEHTEQKDKAQASILKLVAAVKSNEARLSKLFDFLLRKAKDALNHNEEAISHYIPLLIVRCIRENCSVAKQADMLDALTLEVLAAKGVSFFEFFEISPRFRSPLSQVSMDDLEAITGNYLRYCLNRDSTEGPLDVIKFSQSASQLFWHMRSKDSFMQSLSPSQREFLNGLASNVNQGFNGTIARNILADPQGIISAYEAIKDTWGLVSDLISNSPPESLEVLRKVMPPEEQVRYTWPS